MTTVELRALLASVDSHSAEHSPICSCDDCEHARLSLRFAAVNALPALLDAADIVLALGKQPAPTNDYPMSTKGRWGCTLCSGMAHDEDAIVHDEDCAWRRSCEAITKMSAI